MKILLLSAYDAESHRHWCQILMQSFREYQWTLLSLPARYFSWRVRGNSLTWAFSHREVLEGHYDLLIATSMTDLSSLRGFVPALNKLPTLVYFHENQFAYPASNKQFNSVEPQILNLYTALVADKVAFNSDYNRATFLQGVDRLLTKLPDHVPLGLVEKLSAQSIVLSVPLNDSFFQLNRPRPNGPLQLLWNHRWEYDKGPERLFAGIKRVLEKGVLVEIHVVGQQFRQLPVAFMEMKTYLDAQYPEVIKQWGFIESKEEYQQLLASADVVLSTALHDYQGLSVLEAVAAGCIPVVPNRLCYKQWFESNYLYDSFPHDLEQEAEAVSEQLLQLALDKEQGALGSAPDVKEFCISALKSQYSQLFQQTIEMYQHLDG
jgi:glycosyltransferase involved in cell wall biosynthesis